MIDCNLTLLPSILGWNDYALNFVAWAALRILATHFLMSNINIHLPFLRKVSTI